MDMYLVVVTSPNVETFQRVLEDVVLERDVVLDVLIHRPDPDALPPAMRAASLIVQHGMPLCVRAAADLGAVTVTQLRIDGYFPVL